MNWTEGTRSKYSVTYLTVLCLVMHFTVSSRYHLSFDYNQSMVLLE